MSVLKAFTFFVFAIFTLLSSKLGAQVEITTVIPKQNQVLHTSRVVFNWNSSYLETPTSTYSFFLSQDSSFNTTIYTSSNLTESEDSTILNAEGVYYWRVELLDNTELIASSTIFSFTFSDPLAFPNMDLLLRADTGVEVDGLNEVTRWLNLADTANSAVAPTVNERPNLVVNPNLANNNVVRFDGVDDLLEINASLGIAEIYCIANWGGSELTFPSFNGLIAGKSSYFIFVASRFSANFLNRTGLKINNELTTDFAPLNDFKLLNQANTNTLAAPDMLIGRDRTFTNRYWNGDVAEVIVFSSLLSDSTRNLVESYLCTKYSEDLSLGEDIAFSNSLCDTLFQAATVYSSYLWSNGDTTSFSNLSIGNTFSLTVTNEFGCEFVDEISVAPPFYFPNNTAICPGDTVLFDTELSNALYTFNWSDGSNDSLLEVTEQGEYYVELVDLNGCTFQDTFFVAVDSSLFSFTLGNDTSLCEGNSIQLLRDSPIITSYLWSTGSTMPSIPITIPGLYWLEISNGMCVFRDSIIVDIRGVSPDADFSATNFCLNDSVQFQDLSVPEVGDTIVSWSWDLGDGNLSTIQNPRNRYANTIRYRVLLEVETNQGCVDTVSKSIGIEPLPVVNFDFQSSLACSKRAIQHEDNSSVVRGSIVNYNWNFGDPSSSENTSTLRNPTHTFDTLGNYIVTLSVETDQGCRDSIQRLKFINPTPNVDFSVLGQCLSDSIIFNNLTVLPNANVFDYRWSFLNVQNLQVEEANPTVKFVDTGNYFTVLRVRSEVGGIAGCVGEKRDTFELFANPVVNFNVPTVCEGVPFQVNDISTSVDSIVRYTYVYDQRDTFEIREPIILEAVAGDYELNLEVETENGCEGDINQLIRVNSNPEVDFTILNNGTGIPFQLAIENNTIGINDYLWLFGNGDSSSQFIPTYTYRDTGRFQLQLKAMSSEGCVDSLSQEVIVLESFLDATLSRVFFVENSLGDVEVSGQIINTGFNTIYEVGLTADINNSIQSREVYQDTIFRSNSLGFTFTGTFIQEDGRGVDFICVRINSVNGIQDQVLLNDEICERAFNNRIVLNAYPNPVLSSLNFDFVLPSEGNLEIKFYGALGEEVLNPINKFYEPGYYSNLVGVDALRPGVYYYRFIFNGIEESGKFLKQ